MDLIRCTDGVPQVDKNAFELLLDAMLDKASKQGLKSKGGSKPATKTTKTTAHELRSFEQAKLARIAKQK